MNRRLPYTTQCVASETEIIVQNDLLKDKRLVAESVSPYGSRFAVITTDNLLSLHGQSFFESLIEGGLRTNLFVFPDGEHSKTRATKDFLEDQLFEHGFGRDTCIIAVGGGVVTDLAGYLAATYCRGVPFLSVPTSLLAMVDASIGGKTGVNLPGGKNMTGCFYQPKKILIDPKTLDSLPIEEFRNGIVEMIKHGIIVDPEYFFFLEKNTQQLLARQSALLEEAIFESCRIKTQVVEQDEREKGKRHLLNFGHTIGHALETLTHYSIAHGEAVAIGILVECHLAVQLGKLHPKALDRIHHLLIAYGLPLSLPSNLSLESIFGAMMMDKKALKGRPRFVIINAIGLADACQGNYCMHVEEKMLENALIWMNDALCCH